MSKVAQNAIAPKRSENYSEWYQQVIKAADLAETSPVRGCMVIKPWGYAIWERMQKILDRKFKETGHVNAYFPLFIPLSYLEKEAKHVEGFAKECAVVTHHRLETNKDGKLIPVGELEEPYVVRPTSETIIGTMYAKWVQSYRDLPILINQWANVVRWEMRTRLFLRTTEFLWQEGHTAHATKDQAIEETMKILDLYSDFAEHYMAMPVIKGEKTASERFPGAVNTYCIEAMMQDRKALQAGTSHFLGQNFSRAQEIKFLDQQSQQQYAWTTSWGVSTRLIGGLIMTHSDDDGLILPPQMAPQQIVIIPIYKSAEQKSEILHFCQQLLKSLTAVQFDQESVRVFIDDRDCSGGEKGWEHIKKGVPIRVEVGPRDFQSKSVFIGRRDLAVKDKKSMPIDQFVNSVSTVLSEMQNSFYQRAKTFRNEATVKIDQLKDLEVFFKDDDDTKLTGGFAHVHYHECPESIQKLKTLKLSARCIPLDQKVEQGKCIFTGKPSASRVIIAKAY